MPKQERLQSDLRNSPNEQTSITTALYRGVAEVLPDREGLEKAIKERKVRLYLGIDPTSPDLHIGHTVPLRKLRHFQDLGHEVILLFGTFTGMIGDPTDKSAARVRLSRAQIDSNIATYAQQAGRILDLGPKSPNPIQIKHNDRWLSPMTFEQVVDLSSNISVQQMIERDMFKKRMEDRKPIWLHEFLYPLMQGWDSVAMEVDIEVGGRDQTFNMMVGRGLVKRYLNKEKWVVATKLIEDPSGKKMGKTEGNIVNLNDWPEVKFESIMTWPDTAIALGFELLTSVPRDYYFMVEEQLHEGQVNPRDLKLALAYRVVAELDGVDAAQYAEQEFVSVLREGNLPKRIKEVGLAQPTSLSLLLVQSKLAGDENEAMGMISRGAVYVDRKPARGNVVVGAGALVQLGKKTIKNIRLTKTGRK